MKYLSKKLLVLISILLTLVGFVLVWIGYDHTKKVGLTMVERALLDRSYEKIHLLQEHFKMIVDNIKGQSQDTIVVEAVKRFSQGLRTDNSLNSIQKARKELRHFYEVDFALKYSEKSGKKSDRVPDVDSYPRQTILLQHRYIVNNPYGLEEKDRMISPSSPSGEYDNVHKELHPHFVNYLKGGSFYDLFLIDIESGYVVYSVRKETDFGTSLIDGPYKNSSLGKLFHQLKNSSRPDALIFRDYQKYYPSYDAPTSFIGSPVFDNGKKIGIFVAQLSIDKIGHYVQRCGKSVDCMYSYVVGPDRLLRSVFIGKNNELSVERSFLENIRLGMDEVGATKEHFGTMKRIMNFYQDEVYSIATQFAVYGDIKWTIFSEWYLDDIHHLVNYKWAGLFGLFILGVLLLIFQAFLYYQKYGKRLERQEKEIGTLEKDLSAKIDECQSVSAEVRRMESQSASVRQTSREKEDFIKMVTDNVSKNIVPLVKQLKRNPANISKIIDELEKNSLTLVSDPFYKKLYGLAPNLTPAEIRICKMVKEGLREKEMADELNISMLTIKDHKGNIRKKMGLTGNSQKLKTHLANLDKKEEV